MQTLLKATVGKKFATKRRHKEGEGKVTEPPDNPTEFLERGAQIVDDMRKNSDKWSKGEKRKKFMKPKE